jgi:hypothetical protein
MSGKTALQLLVEKSGWSAAAPSAPEWHWNSVPRGMPESESSRAGSPSPARPLSSGSSRKIASGFGKPSDW